MTENKDLYEQYEEAFFAMLMDKIADAEGAELIKQNRMLQADPAAAVPAETTKRCLRLIRHQYHKAQRQRTARHSMRIITRIAVALMCLLVLYAVAFAASETVRVNTLNFLVQELDVGTQYLFPGDEVAVENEDELIPDILDAISKAVPSSFTLISSEENIFERVFQFQNENGNEIYVQIWNLYDSAASATIDTEDADVQYQTIEGQDVMIVSKFYTNQVYQVVWVDEVKKYMVDIIGRDVPIEDLLPIAEVLITR